MKPYLLCPTCGSDDIVKNGLTRRAKQNYKCRDCGRQFVEDPQWRVIPPDSQALIERLLLEKLPLAGIARVMQVSKGWLQHYVNSYYSTLPHQVQVLAKSKQSLQVQMDELWSFIDNKGDEQWVWLALDTDTREVVGCYVGDRSA